MKYQAIRGLAAAALCAISCWAGAQETPAEGEVCAAPGLTVLTDPTGDVTTGVAPVPLPLAMADIVSVQVAYDEAAAKVIFTLTLDGAISALPPNFAWYTSFKGPNNQFYGVRMVTDITTLAAFQSYTLGESTGGQSDGRFVGDIKPAEGSYDGNVITVIVPALDIGVRGNSNELQQFNAGSVLEVGAGGVGVAASVLDGAPDDLSRRGEVVLSCGDDDEEKGLLEQFGGALNFGLLLPLLALAGLRRRRRDA